MHVSAMSPQFISVNDIDANYKKKEQEIILAQSQEDPSFAKKPEKIQQGIITGRLNKQLQEITLEEQQFVKDTSQKVKDYVKSKNAKIEEMLRFEVGEGLEAQKVDFVEEVKKQMQ